MHHKEIASQKKLDKQSGIEPIYMQGSNPLNHKISTPIILILKIIQSRSNILESSYYINEYMTGYFYQNSLQFQSSSQTYYFFDISLTPEIPPKVHI